jgi:hypothetical protein
MWEGADFKLKIRKVEGYQNYDKSEFASAAPLLDDDTQLEKIWKSEHSLAELVADKEFKPYDDLKGRLEKVLGLNGEEPVAKTTVEQARSLPKAKPTDGGEPWEPPVSEDDDMAYFAKLADE